MFIPIPGARPNRLILFLMFFVAPAEDVSKLGRKYLPPGTLWEIFQFYTGWCSAHNVQEQASHQVWIRCLFHGWWCAVFLMLLNLDAVWMSVFLDWGMVHLCGGGARSGHWSWSSEIRAASVNVMCVRNWRPSYLDAIQKIFMFLVIQTFSFVWCNWTCFLFLSAIHRKFRCHEIHEWGVKVPRQKPAHGCASWCSATVPPTPCCPIRRPLCFLESERYISWANVQDLHYHDWRCRSGYLVFASDLHAFSHAGQWGQNRLQFAKPIRSEKLTRKHLCYMGYCVFHFSKVVLQGLMLRQNTKFHVILLSDHAIGQARFNVPDWNCTGHGASATHYSWQS